MTVLSFAVTVGSTFLLLLQSAATLNPLDYREIGGFAAFIALTIWVVKSQRAENSELRKSLEKKEEQIMVVTKEFMKITEQHTEVVRDLEKAITDKNTAELAEIKDMIHRTQS